MSEDPFEAEVVWRPGDEARTTSRLGRFLDWAAARDLGRFATYGDAWDWSVADPTAFWGAVRDHFALPITGESAVLDLGVTSPTGLPGARWFPGAMLNAAAVILDGAGRPNDATALLSRSQSRDGSSMTYGELRAEVARVRRGLVALGVSDGDCVAGYAPNIPETIVAYLATVSLGAIWTSCAPEFGIRSVLDRLTQTRPKVLVAIDGYRYGDRAIARGDEVAAITAELASLEAVVHIGYLEPDTPGPSGSLRWEELDGPVDPGVRQVPFDHPLWVLYSSGTTGLPKAIVHSHGGITLEHHKAHVLQSDLGPGDRFFWFTTTGWMMWNYLVSGLAVGATIVLFDGDPGAAELDTLWALAEECAVTAFGVSAPFLDACRHRGLDPGSDHDLSALRWLGSTGAPLGTESYRWITERVAPVPISSISGGTDVCTAFVGAAPLLPVRAGVIPCRFLGADVHAFDRTGNSVVGSEGELVVTTPMPSMPIGLWDDPDGSRLRAAYFERFDDVWWHGDWITIADDGECVISGRSDATLNRGGVRLGTADFYTVVEEIAGVADSLVVHLDSDGRDELIAFVVTSEGVALDDELVTTIRSALRGQLSPRHVPDLVVAVDAVPRTLSGKKTEVPVKRILAGASVSDALAAGALADPGAIDAYVSWAHRHAGTTGDHDARPRRH
ncbi:MAG TPA: acetoacetate--CoA ligase [Acidimicrobiales bacterium]|nr:acetoacetate--CoA ligase [Acidimicrobiales bacterium]